MTDLDAPQLVEPVVLPYAAGEETRRQRVGFFYGLAAYLAWGFIPAYFKLLHHVPPMTVLAHRVVWSVLFMGIVLSFTREWGPLLRALRSRSVLLTLAASTIMIAINWYTFIWAVANDKVLQASLGYYINPLVAVLLGAVVLRERLRPWQLVAVAVAAAAVLMLVVAQGVVPWVSLALAISFGMYGLLRKIASVGPAVGLMIETALLFPIAFIFMKWQAVDGSPLDGKTYGFLMAAGVVTALPLLWFAAGTRRLRLATMGFLQYIAPTLQFLLAVVAYHETFRGVQVAAFALIWSALAVYAIDSARAIRANRIASVAN